MLRQADYSDCLLIATYGNRLVESTTQGKLFRGFGISEGQIDQYVDLESTRMIVEDDEVIGFVSYGIFPWLNVRMGKITYVYIEPEFRGKGHMKDVIKDFESWGSKCDYLILGLTTDTVPKGYEKFEVMYMKEVK